MRILTKQEMLMVQGGGAAGGVITPAPTPTPAPVQINNCNSVNDKSVHHHRCNHHIKDC